MTPKPVNKSSINPKYSNKINDAANKVLLGNNIIKYIVDVANINHKSDQDLFRIAILSCIQHSVEDYNYGLYLNIVGSAGKGKSHALNVLTKLLPARNPLAWPGITTWSLVAIPFLTNSRIAKYSCI